VLTTISEPVARSNHYAKALYLQIKRIFRMKMRGAGYVVGSPAKYAAQAAEFSIWGLNSSSSLLPNHPTPSESTTPERKTLINPNISETFSIPHLTILIRLTQFHCDVNGLLLDWSNKCRVRRLD